MTEEYTHTYLNVSKTQAPAIIPEEFQIKQILNWIGFGTSQLELIYNDSITKFKDLMTMAKVISKTLPMITWLGLGLVIIPKTYSLGCKESRNLRHWFIGRKILRGLIKCQPSRT